MSDWLTPGLAPLWLPYTQMKTAPTPLPVVSAKGVRLRLADGRELIDGISSWWTACHGYAHPHIRAAVEAQLATLPHVMFAGLVHEPAARLAARLAVSRISARDGHVAVTLDSDVARAANGLRIWVPEGALSPGACEDDSGCPCAD